jgi:RND family efflux transporter MFP subunit
MLRKILMFTLPVIVLVIALASAYALVVTKPIPEQIETPESTTAIRVLRVVPGQRQLTVSSQGSVVPRTQSELIPEVSGRVHSISPNLVTGGYFEADEILLQIDDRDYKSKVDRSKAAVTRARAEDEHARFELKRLQKLAKNKLTSQSQLESAIRVQRIALATLQDAEIALVQAQRDLRRTQLRAPFTGLVRNERVDLGQFVSRGQSIASLYASDFVEVRLPIADKQLAYLDLPLGHRGEFSEADSPSVIISTFYGGQHYQWQGRLVRTEAEIDMKSRMINVIARVDSSKNSNQPPLPIGLFVNAEIEGRWVEDIISLPRAAMRNGNQVLIVDADNRLRFRDVEMLRFDREEVLVKSGLRPGELVNISPIQTVVDGMRVKPIQQDNKGA